MNDNKGRTRTRMVLWEEHPQSPVAAPAKALECLEAVYECSSLGSQIICPSHTDPLFVPLSSRMAAKMVGANSLQKMWEGPYL